MTYSDFKTTCINKKLNIQAEKQFVGEGYVYYAFAYDSLIKYETDVIENNDIEDFETNYINNGKVNNNSDYRNDYGMTIIAPTIEDVMGLYPKKKMYRNEIDAGSTNFIDVEVNSEKRICGGEYWVSNDDVEKVHADDYIEFSVIDKNDVLGLFATYGLTVGVDILELVKFVITDYVKCGNPANGYHSQLYEGIKGSNRVIPGLFYRVAYDSHGTEDLTFFWRMYYYE